MENRLNGRLPLAIFEARNDSVGCRRQHATEADHILGIVRAAVPAKFRAEVHLEGSIPSGATRHPERFVLRIETPFPDIAASVVQAQAVRAETAHGGGTGTRRV